MKDNQTVISPPADYQHNVKAAKDHGPKVFAFDRSYWSFDRGAPNYAAQSNLFDDLGKPLLDNAFKGYNNCIFAYGQTGSGKSYSMMGYGKEHGIIPNICQDMFQRIEALQGDRSLKCTVEVSYLEIYNERVRDLLNPSTKGNLKVREHPSTGPYVEDLAKLVVGSFQEIENLMDEGNKARTVAATNMNQTSSRSHAVFTLMLTQKRFDLETRMEMEKVAKISLVDLAGSERATSTGATGARLKEGAEINRSLSTLGRVISSLADASSSKKKKAQVPYRDSVLTWLLKDSLGGNSMTAMIAAISPADINFDETLSTLRYADSAKRIKNHAVINEDANARMIRELKEELAQLRSKLGSGAAGIRGPGGTVRRQVLDPSLPPERQMISITQPDGTVKQVSRAEITERLNQNEKLLAELNQTWEQKLQKTEQIQREREASLEEFGISIDKSQGALMSVSTPKNTPHLVNLSDDALLAESLVLLLRPGTTLVCNARCSPAADAPQDGETRHIMMNGVNIKPHHCSFDHAPDGTVTLVPCGDASIMVNGKPITEPRKLTSGNRIILGDFHIFRFNHPAQVRAERAERNEQRESLLRQSITASQLQALDRMSPIPGSRPVGHERSWSRADSEFGESRPDSPANARPARGDSEWALARREAAPALLGLQGQSFAKLTDEELDALYEDVARAREARAEERREGDDDADSVSSLPLREKYLSGATADNFSLDTALTGPPTPKLTDEEKRAEQERIAEKIKEQVKEEQEKEKREWQEAHKKEIEAMKQELRAKIDEMDPLKKPRPKGNPILSPKEVEIAKDVVKYWRSRRYVHMAESVLQHAVALKEAQVMSHELDEHVLFQFTIVDKGHLPLSTYDMILKDLDENDDAALEESRKPCVGVRVIDYRHEVIHIWSLEKLHERIRLMRQTHQYLDQPEYLQHLSLDNPFVESCMPRYSLIAEVDVPLQSVFQTRVQDFTLDAISPYNARTVGIIKVNLEPSTARAPPNMLKFNAVLNEMVGFPEREGTEVHAMLYIPGISHEGGSGCVSTQMISDFDETPIRFDSVHSMTVPLLGPPDLQMRIAIFAKATPIHLDKLLSWDGMRDARLANEKPKTARIAETQYYTEEKHDILARIQILQLGGDGSFAPVDVVQTSDLDPGVFLVCQPFMSRIAINLAHSSGDALPWDEICNLRAGKVQLVDLAGKMPDMTLTPEVALSCGKPVFKEHANGTRTVTISGAWNRESHDSQLLMRPTGDRYRVQLTLLWEINSPKLAEPMKFSTTIHVQIVPLSYQRAASAVFGSSVLGSLGFNGPRVVHSTSRIFAVTLKPAPLKRVGELWRMDSQHDYVKGEEILEAWSPRGVSLIRDFIDSKKARARMAEISHSQRLLRKIGLPEKKPPTLDDDEIPLPRLPDDDDEEDEALNDGPEAAQPSDPEEAFSADKGLANPPLPPEPGLSEKEKSLLAKFVAIWQRNRDPIHHILRSDNTDPPQNGVASEPMMGRPALTTTIVPVAKHPRVMKSGYLLMPNNDSTRWVKRWVELRRPYLHIYTVKDQEELAIISLRNSQIESQPSVLAMLNGPGEDYMMPEEHSSEVYRPRTSGNNTLGHDGTNGTTSSTSHANNNGGSLTGLFSSLRLVTANTNVKGDHQALTKLSERALAGVFTIYGKDNTWLLAAPTEGAKMSWVTKIDQSWGSSPGSSVASVPLRELASRAASPLPGVVRGVLGFE